MKRTEKTLKINNDLPLYLFHQGTNYNAYDYMGAHLVSVNGNTGVVFRVWAPNANSVSVVGDFNKWDENANYMTRISDGGVFELFIKDIKEYDC
jgi:1,4-alpha-glucan branching enzyme